MYMNRTLYMQLSQVTKEDEDVANLVAISLLRPQHIDAQLSPRLKEKIEVLALTNVTRLQVASKGIYSLLASPTISEERKELLEELLNRAIESSQDTLENATQPTNVFLWISESVPRGDNKSSLLPTE